MRICARCDRQIQGHEAYEEQHWPSMSGPGRVAYRHAVDCQRRPPPTQTAPTQYRGYGRAG
ncbi:hypothetical protein AB852_28640 [Streptomyces uncialis]|uniref:Uncharacterized protein n=1 Tax=Streptomyces uncialis TaxID=1048205 RepID=A0A1Q4V150_9ACTN|nr:hypothetical protein AB852_28640 [Streptomyces uncialis]